MTDAAGPVEGAVRRPPRALLALLVLSLLFTVFPVGFAVQYTQGWSEARRGRDGLTQKLSLKGVAWFKRPFLTYVMRLRNTVPEDARILCIPHPVETEVGDARWFLFLNHWAHPLRFYVRRPDRASGTLVDYPRWLAYNDKHPELDEAERAALDELGIEWRLTYPVRTRFEIEEVLLERRTEAGWEPVELGPLRRAEPSDGGGS